MMETRSPEPADNIAPRATVPVLGQSYIYPSHDSDGSCAIGVDLVVLDELLIC